MEKDSRTKILIGNHNLDIITNIKVLVVGIGGVGGQALEMLVRCGVENITIVDYDTFEESNLNRQILSLTSNIGQKKIDVAKKRALEINSRCKINTILEKVDSNMLNNLPSNFDYIIDACDDLQAKVALVKYAVKNNVKIISCCGTGNRVNPEKLKISNIWKTEYDPLAKKFRSELRKEKINYKLPVVFSSEQPIKTNGVIGSLATVPNSAGILLASYVINDVISK